jgi:colanic acid biosynthesis glycosyl transferase WcaI
MVQLRKTDVGRMMNSRRPRILMISQVYIPDSTSVGQHFADVAEEMARRGWDVRVYAASRGYSDPSLVFPRRQVQNGVDVRRLPLSSFGKTSIPVRLLAQVLFMVQVVLFGLLTPGLRAIFVSTSPPFAGFGAAVIGMVRRVPFLWWVMDLNPDQLLVAGKVKPKSLFVRVFDWMNRVTLRRAAKVVTLDPFMADRLKSKLDVSSKIAVMPPWPHNEPANDGHPTGNQGRNSAGLRFRDRQGLGDRFVVMYSGNHAIQHPLGTLLDAAARLEHDESLVFVFVGGGAGKGDVERRLAAGATNIVSLPHQPIETLQDSLGAADMHVVSMGPEVVGIMHPSKIYGAMAAGRPILFFGPRESHAGALVEPRGIGWRVEHGDVEGTIAVIREAAAMDRQARLAMGKEAARIITNEISRSALLSRMGDLVEALPAIGR